MKEKKFTRWFTMYSLILIGCFVIATTAIRYLLPHTLRETAFTLKEVELFGYDQNVQLDDFTFEMDPSGLITVKDMEYQNQEIYMTMEATENGGGDVFFTVIPKNPDVPQYSTLIHVEKDGWLLDYSTGNFSNYRISHFCITALVIAFACLLWLGFMKSRKELGFSYQSIFCIGLANWISIIAVLLIVGVIRKDSMLSVYTMIADAPVYFIFFTFPVIFLFAIALMISNISLIRHEGFRFTNALGGLLALAMIGGFLILTLLSMIGMHGSTFKVNLLVSLMDTLYTGYAILECFLLGAVICGTLAAKNQPAYNKDYIVILGCLIRKDGTLYPLIRGRVDRAIRFYKDQLAATGKKAIFVPSGGQGKNEIISEAEAMRRYLLDQGIEPEQIMIEDQSKNTRQNMEFSKALIGENANAVFSTTNFHVFRSGIISRQVGFEADGMGSPTKWYFWPNAYVREVIGMLSYKWKSLVLLYIPTIVFFVSFIFIFTS